MCIFTQLRVKDLVTIFYLTKQFSFSHFHMSYVDIPIPVYSFSTLSIETSIFVIIGYPVIIRTCDLNIFDPT